MSECHKTLQLFTNALIDHRKLSGQRATVVIAGKNSYDELRGAIAAIFSDEFSKLVLSDSFQFMGVPVLRTWVVDDGFYPGSQDS